MLLGKNNFGGGNFMYHLHQGAGQGRVSQAFFAAFFAASEFSLLLLLTVPGKLVRKSKLQSAFEVLIYRVAPLPMLPVRENGLAP